MYLVFDTETSGLPLWDEEPFHPNQARIVQLGMILLDDHFNEMATFCALVRPSGWKIQEGAYNAHHISQQMCEEYGFDISNILTTFDTFAQMADIIISYNLKFDSFLMDTEQSLKNTGLPFKYDWQHQGFCAMLAATAPCGLKQANGKSKWPKLQEAYKMLCCRDMPANAHNALVDCRATIEVYKALKAKLVHV
jgi:DNA polymerase III subunit epsilon